MFSFLLGLGVGLLVGWYLPQPEWAKSLVDPVVAKVKGWFGGNTPTQ